MPIAGSIPDSLSERYTRFAENEVRGRSALYEALARGVAHDAEIIDFLSTLPPAKQQPNLLFAAVRFLEGIPKDFGDFKLRLLDSAHAVRSLMLARSTQTSEPARCATLLPVSAQLPQPLALIEVGASAGLCLLPDFYGYDFGASAIQPEVREGTFPVFHCTASPETRVPAKMPRIGLRATPQSGGSSYGTGPSGGRTGTPTEDRRHAFQSVGERTRTNLQEYP